MVGKNLALMSVALTFLTVLALTALSAGANNQTSYEVSHQAARSSFVAPKSFLELWLVYNLGSAESTPMVRHYDGVLSTTEGNVATRLANINKAKPFSRLKRLFLLEQQPENWPQNQTVADKSIAIEHNFTLDGCFSLSSESTPYMPGTKAPSVLCFEATGSVQSLETLQHNNPGSLSAHNLEALVQGSYSIANHVVSIAYSNGKQLSALLGAYRFGEQAPIFSAISIGEHVYFRLPNNFAYQLNT